jgi:hypothetical protein
LRVTVLDAKVGQIQERRELVEVLVPSEMDGLTLTLGEVVVVRTLDAEVG